MDADAAAGASLIPNQTTTYDVVARASHVCFGGAVAAAATVVGALEGFSTAGRVRDVVAGDVIEDVAEQDTHNGSAGGGSGGIG